MKHLHTLTFGSLTLTGIVDYGWYADGNIALTLIPSYGEPARIHQGQPVEHISMNLLPTGHPTHDGEFYVKNDYEGLAQSLVDAGIAEIVEAAHPYGPFDTTAARMRLLLDPEDQPDHCKWCGVLIEQDKQEFWVDSAEGVTCDDNERRSVHEQFIECHGCGSCDNCQGDDVYLSGSGELMHDEGYIAYLNGGG